MQPYTTPPEQTSRRPTWTETRARAYSNALYIPYTKSALTTLGMLGPAERVLYKGTFYMTTYPLYRVSGVLDILSVGPLLVSWLLSFTGLPLLWESLINALTPQCIKSFAGPYWELTFFPLWVFSAIGAMIGACFHAALFICVSSAALSVELGAQLLLVAAKILTETLITLERVVDYAFGSQEEPEPGVALSSCYTMVTPDSPRSTPDNDMRSNGEPLRPAYGYENRTFHHAH